MIFFSTSSTNIFKFWEAQSILPNVLPLLLLLLHVTKVEPSSFPPQITTRNYSVQPFPYTKRQFEATPSQFQNIMALRSWFTLPEVGECMFVYFTWLQKKTFYNCFYITYIYIYAGEGKLGIVFLRFLETFRDHSSLWGRSGCRSESPREEEEEKEEDSSQKVRWVRRGYVIALFAGETH